MKINAMKFKAKTFFGKYLLSRRQKKFFKTDVLVLRARYKNSPKMLKIVEWLELRKEVPVPLFSLDSTPVVPFESIDEKRFGIVERMIARGAPHASTRI